MWKSWKVLRYLTTENCTFQTRTVWATPTACLKFQCSNSSSKIFKPVTEKKECSLTCTGCCQCKLLSLPTKKLKSKSLLLSAFPRTDSVTGTRSSTQQKGLKAWKREFLSTTEVLGPTWNLLKKKWASAYNKMARIRTLYNLALWISTSTRALFQN